jgi:hypothetical protein
MIVKRPTTFWLITICLIVVKLAIHFFTSTNYELHRDEMLYFAQGMHLDWGYVSTPPFIGFLAWLSRNLFGYSEFALKLFPTLAGVASILIIALFVKELGGKNRALFTAGIAYLISGAFLRSNSLFQPVSFDQLFRMVNRNEPKTWIWIGISLGLGFMNKYSIAILALVLLLVLAFSQHRKLFLSKYFLVALLAGLVIIAPNLYWQYNHYWPVVHHMAELQRTQLVNVSYSGFLIDQVFMTLPAFLVWIIGLVVLLILKKERNLQWLAWSFILVIALILLARGKSYYTLGVYPMMIVCGAYAMEKYFTGWLQWINYSVLVLGVAISIYALPLELPVASFEKLERYCDPAKGMAQRWEDGQIHPVPQDYADMTGWKELTGLVVAAYNQLDESEKPFCTIFGENYGLAGAVQFYGQRYNLPQPISFADNYLLWTPDQIPEGPVIFINHEVGDLDDLFQSVIEVGKVENPYFRESGVIVFLCRNRQSFAGSFYSDKVKMLKSAYCRQ